MRPGHHHFLTFLGLWIVWSISPGGTAQDSKKPPAAQPDHSAEAYVVEQSMDQWNFENDGTGTRGNTVRVRIQSDAGVERYGLLTLPYEKAVETAEFDYVRVRKPDGSVVPTPMDDLQDMPAEITREAPFYSDLREKQLAVKGLSKGDVLEYQCHWNMSKPLIPGQFWMQSGFSHDEVILEETLQVSVPRGRTVKFKSAGLAPVIREEGPRRIYTWKRSNLEVEQRPKSELANLAIHGNFPAPDVQLSSFQSWEEIGRWYAGLQQDRIVPSAEVRAKAAELTKSATDDSAKIQSIYKYVSTEYRYIGVGFGIGRYQPHTAAEVLSNQYGDCKDKHTLLAALLAAAGIPAYAALINSSRVLDTDVPSPAQFDHLITVVPRGKDLLWLDTTTEVGPLGYLESQIRDKQALVVFPDKAALQTTPANPPYPMSWTFRINAKLDDSGTLQGKVEHTIRGDLEVIWRSALRGVSKNKWKEVAQRISYSLGFGGEVSDVTASLPEAIETPLHLAYTYTRKDYPNWKDHRIAPPAPTIFLIPTEEEGKLPEHLWLGAPGEFQFESRVELPKGYAPELPPGKDLKEDFAEYHSSYSIQDNVLVAHYRVVVKSIEVAGEQIKTYQNLAEKARKDQEQLIPLLSQRAQSPAEVLSTLQQRLWELQDSANPKALQSEQDARRAIQRRSYPDAIVALKEAVSLDPKFTRDWIVLGEMYMAGPERNDGIDALRHAVAVDPNEPLPYKFLALAFTSTGRRAEAIQVWQDLAKIAPQDRDVAASLGNLLLAEKRFAEAVPYLETAAKLYPENPAVTVALGTAYLQSGNEDKAIGIFAQAIQAQPGALAKNDVAYALANANKRLEDALRYAQEAVHEEEEASLKVELSKLVVDDLKHTPSLGAYWDTLGWVWFRRSDLKQAEEYLYAAWTLRQDPIIGYHLAQVYEKQQRKQEATHMYRFVASVGEVGRGPEDLEAIAEAKKQLAGSPVEPLRKPGSILPLESPGGELSKDRTASLPKLVAKQATAEFFLTFAPAKNTAVPPSRAQVGRDAVVEDTKFVSGSDLLQSAGDALHKSHFKMAFPQDGSARLVRRGLLACFPLSGCSITLFPVNDVRRVD